MPEPSQISEAELEVLKALWKEGSATVRELDHLLRAEGKSWAYNTVLTLLQRLQAKGYVRSDKRSVAHVFHPAVTREELLSRSLRDLADRVCEGTAAPLVRALVEGRRFSREEIAELRGMVERLEAEKKTMPREKKRRGRELP